MFFHPWNVGYTWRKVYGSWPNLYEWCSVIAHDAAYFDCPDIDGAYGKSHPFDGARLAQSLAIGIAWIAGEDRREQIRRGSHAYFLALLHSRSIATRLKEEPSKLCAPDKLCVLYEYRWFYLLRARLSGEIVEFKARAVQAGHIQPGATDGEWFDDYCARVEKEFL